MKFDIVLKKRFFIDKANENSSDFLECFCQGWLCFILEELTPPIEGSPSLTCQ
jgi:hypothetical protein